MTLPAPCPHCAAPSFNGEYVTCLDCGCIGCVRCTVNGESHGDPETGTTGLQPGVPLGCEADPYGIRAAAEEMAIPGPDGQPIPVPQITDEDLAEAMAEADKRTMYRDPPTPESDR